jgi:hypothetical protein
MASMKSCDQCGPVVEVGYKTLGWIKVFGGSSELRRQSQANCSGRCLVRASFLALDREEQRLVSKHLKPA